MPYEERQNPLGTERVYGEALSPQARFVAVSWRNAGFAGKLLNLPAALHAATAAHCAAQANKGLLPLYSTPQRAVFFSEDSLWVIFVIDTKASLR